MLNSESSIDINKIKKHISYNPYTGEFVWLLPTSIRVKTGQKAQSFTKTGYYELSIFNKRFLCHRLAWLLEKGSIEGFVIDHINGIKTDNRIVNLRAVKDLQNLQNKVKADKRSKTGVRGVYLAKSRNKWVAQITIDRKTKHLGSFDSIEKAKQEYIKAKKQFHSAPILD